MITIELKCSCGASASFKDSKGAYINPGGKLDEKGREFKIEIWADKWYEKHSSCLHQEKKVKS